MTTQIKCRKKEFFQYDFLGEIYAGNAERVGKYGFPQLEAEEHIPTQQVRPFNYMMSLKEPEKWWIHCFCDDYQFERLWNRLDFYMYYINRLDGFISTDFSLYRDYDDDQLIWNCYRNRCIAAAVQRAGGRMIPTAGFGPERTWSWCFDGLPKNSTVAVTTNGVLSDPEGRRLFAGGIEALVYTLHPRNLVVCGKYPEWLNNKYPNVNVIGIPSYGQQWKRRCL